MDNLIVKNYTLLEKVGKKETNLNITIDSIYCITFFKSDEKFKI